MSPRAWLRYRLRLRGAAAGRRLLRKRPLLNHQFNSHDFSRGERQLESTVLNVKGSLRLSEQAEPPCRENTHVRGADLCSYRLVARIDKPNDDSRPVSRSLDVQGEHRRAATAHPSSTRLLCKSSDSATGDAATQVAVTAARVEF